MLLYQVHSRVQCASKESTIRAHGMQYPHTHTEIQMHKKVTPGTAAAAASQSKTSKNGNCNSGICRMAHVAKIYLRWNSNIIRSGTYRTYVPYFTYSAQFHRFYRMTILATVRPANKHIWWRNERSRNKRMAVAYGKHNNTYIEFNI